MSEWGYWVDERKLGVKRPYWLGFLDEKEAKVAKERNSEFAPKTPRGPVQFGKDPNPFESKPAAPPAAKDDVNQPSHYTSHPSGIECIQVVEHYPFNLGNAIKYIWRAGLKTPDPIKDLRKAAFYIDREIKRLEKK